MGLSDLNWTDLKSFHRNNLAGDANCHFLCDLLTVKRIPARLDLFQGSVKDSNGTVSEAAAWGEEKQHKRRHRAKQEVSTLTWTVELSALKFAQHYLHTLYVHRHSHTHALRWQKKSVTTYEHMLWKTQGQEKELGRCIMGRQKVCLHSHCKQISRLMNLWWIQLWLWLQLNQRAYSRSGRTKVFKCSHIFSLFGRHPLHPPESKHNPFIPFIYKCFTRVPKEVARAWGKTSEETLPCLILTHTAGAEKQKMWHGIYWTQTKTKSAIFGYKKEQVKHNAVEGKAQNAVHQWGQTGSGQTWEDSGRSTVEAAAQSTSHSPSSSSPSSSPSSSSSSLSSQ